MRFGRVADATIAPMRPPSPRQEAELHAPRAQPGPQNRYDRMEWSGAFGDLGTLIPFLVVYIGLLGMQASGVLLAFGAAMLACGLYYRTPFPVQPMKAIGAVAAAQAVQTATVTPGAVVAAALATGIVWLVLGLSGSAHRLSRLVPPAVVAGLVLGLGLGFMLEGVRQMQTSWWIAGVAGGGTLLMLTRRGIPAMLVLLLFGAGVGLVQEPSLAGRLADADWGFAVPRLPVGTPTWDDVVVGVVFLALPQLPLTLGNAVIAVTQENNRLFPQAPVSERKVAISTGLMNLASGSIGGVPMCHGAGGMAAHVAFGARTGGSLVIAGAVLLGLALFAGDSVVLLFELFPTAVLGVVLFIAGARLALGGVEPLTAERSARLVVLVTAAVCVWNVALGLLVGLLLHQLRRRGLLRP